MRYAILLLTAALAAAQTSQYPGSLDTDSTLFVTADNVQSSLSVAMSAGDNVAVVKSGTGFAVNMIATVCDTVVSGKCTAWEHMLITAVNGQALTVTRAFAGTSATSHAAGKLVSVLIDAAHQAALKDAVIKIETALGPNLNKVGLGSFFNVKSYGAVGDGATNDTAAIHAAITAATAGGGTVLMPPGTYNITAALHIPSKVTLAGSGQESTTIYIPNNTLTANGNWQITGQAGQYCVICMDPGTSYQRLRDFTVNSNGQNQTWFYYAEVFGYNASNVIVDRVTVKNHTISGGTGTTFMFLGHSPLTSNTNNVIMNSTSIGIAGCLVPNGGGAFYIEGEGTRIISSYAKDFCDSPFVISLCDHCTIDNSVADVGGGQMATPTFSIEGAQYSTISNASCIGTGTNGHRYCAGVASIPAMQSVGNRIINLSALKSSNALELGANNSAFSGVTNVKDTEIIGLHVENTLLDCVFLSEYVDGARFIGGELNNCGSSGISMYSTGAGPLKVISNVTISGMRIDHGAAPGILLANNSTGPTGANITIVDNWIGDSNGSPTQTYGIMALPGNLSNLVVKGNTFIGNTTAPLYWQGHLINSIIGPNVTDKSDSTVDAYTVGATVASAGTITPSGPIFHVSGTAAIATITAQTSTLGSYYGACIRLIPDGAFTTTTAGNIALASTAVVGKILTMCYDGGAAAGAGRWFPSY